MPGLPSTSRRPPTGGVRPPTTMPWGGGPVQPLGSPGAGAGSGNPGVQPISLNTTANPYMTGAYGQMNALYGSGQAMDRDIQNQTERSMQSGVGAARDLASGSAAEAAEGGDFRGLGGGASALLGQRARESGLQNVHKTIGEIANVGLGRRLQLRGQQGALLGAQGGLGAGIAGDLRAQEGTQINAYNATQNAYNSQAQLMQQQQQQQLAALMALNSIVPGGVAGATAVPGTNPGGLGRPGWGGGGGSPLGRR